MKRKWFVLLCAVGAMALVAVGAGSSAVSAKNRFTSKLSPLQEVPRPAGNVARATGTFRALIKRSGSRYRLNWSLTFGGLTGKPTQAHIHIGKLGKAGNVAAPLCGPCGKGAGGLRFISATLVKAMRNGNAYVNVHTKRNKKGEIRGQIKTR